MNRFLQIHIFKEVARRWLLGISILIFWTVAFVTLPALSGWFLAASSVAFITANTMFAYLIPSAIIRLLTLLRTASRYFERLENHKTTLDSQRSLQLTIFQAVSRLPYFKKQVNNNSTILENSTHGIDLILNHILLWLLPFTTLIIVLGMYSIFLSLFSQVIAIEFLLSASFLLFLIPQYIFHKNRILYATLKLQREENNQSLIQSFRGRIEISKYNLEEKAVGQHKARMLYIEKLEHKLQTNSFTLQFIIGLGFSLIGLFILWNTSNYNFDTPLAIGIFFGIMAHAELAEMLFSGKSEKSSVVHQITDLDTIIKQGNQTLETVNLQKPFESLSLQNKRSRIPETDVTTEALTLTIKKGEWIAMYGETGKGKTTLLNSLFYPEYHLSGMIRWNDETDLPHLPVPACIYVTQKAYLLTGTLRENFENYSDDEIESALETVDLKSWYLSLPNGLDTWLGENGETLSGGQRKKLLLAQALLKNPQVLVVDEPTAGISTENAIAVFQKIRINYPHMSILMATHLKEFESVVDKVVKIA
jgi:ATP-binding cassette subfamily C protein CydC